MNPVYAALSYDVKITPVGTGEGKILRLARGADSPDMLTGRRENLNAFQGRRIRPAFGIHCHAVPAAAAGSGALELGEYPAVFHRSVRPHVERDDILQKRIGNI
jgi:hypothetical protein